MIFVLSAYIYAACRRLYAIAYNFEFPVDNIEVDDELPCS